MKKVDSSSTYHICYTPCVYASSKINISYGLLHLALNCNQNGVLIGL